MTENVDKKIKAADASQGGSIVPESSAGKIIWNDREMRSSYANVINVATSNDEVMLLFGTSETWNNAQKDVMVKLNERVIMTPATARRFQKLLTQRLDEFEKNAISRD
jgi:uncharacterized protein DUF3467